MHELLFDKITSIVITVINAVSEILKTITTLSNT